MQAFLDKLTDLLDRFAGGALRYALLAAVAVVVLWIAWRVLRRRRRVSVPLSPDLKILVANLGKTARRRVRRSWNSTICRCGWRPSCWRRWAGCAICRPSSSFRR